VLEKLPSGIGRSLQGQHAGMEEVAAFNVGLKADAFCIELESPAFGNNQPLQRRHTADGEGISPALTWSGVPAQATTLVLIVEDPDAPTPSPFVHAIAVDISADVDSLAEGALSAKGSSADFKAGRNSYLQANWLPPDPPPGHGPHRYVFQLFALASGPAFPEHPGRTVVMDAITERAVAAGWVIATYERS
jgi:Raf kinase inhibitor-like YbhB/YbcL family protein